MENTQEKTKVETNGEVKNNKWSLFVKQTSTEPSKELLEKIRKQIEVIFY